MSRPKASLTARLVNVALVALALGLLGVVVWQNRGKIQEVIDRRPDGRPFALGFAIAMVALLSTFVRWWLLVRVAGLAMRLRDAVRLGYVGNVFNLLIPGAVGGDAIKVYYLWHEHPGHKAEAVASIAIDRIVGLLGLFLLGAVAGLAYWPGARADVKTLILMVWAAALAGAVGLAVLFAPALYRPMARLFAGRGRLEALFDRLLAMASAYRRRIGTVLATIGMSMVNHALNVLAFYLVGIAMFGRETPSLAQHFLLVPLVMFSTAVPVPFGALGLTELVSEGLFKLVRHPDGAVGMMGFRLLMYGGGLIGLAVYLANLRQVRALEEEIEATEGGPAGEPVGGAEAVPEGASPSSASRSELG